MFDSKVLKDFPEEKTPWYFNAKIHRWWLESRLVDWYHQFTWKFLGKPISQVKKLYGWYVNVFRNDFDFDGHSLFAIIEYKLKRVEKSLLKGLAIQDPKDLRALKLAIKLAGRLKDDNYYTVVHDRMEKKWGKLKSWFTPYKDRPDMSEWHSKYEKENTEEDKENSNKERRFLYETAYAKSKREERWLYDILHKYLRVWWD